MRGTWTNIVRGVCVNVELKVTPDKYLPHRYAGASGDFNPIHIDPEFAKQVGPAVEHPARALRRWPRWRAPA